jgi:hypothetical protein
VLLLLATWVKWWTTVLVMMLMTLLVTFFGDVVGDDVDGRILQNCKGK